jgi:hypothetical protein
MEIFNNRSRTYKTRENAVKVIRKIEADIERTLAETDKESHEMVFKWFIGATEDGRFFPVVTHIGKGLSFHYFINSGCCYIG